MNAIISVVARRLAIRFGTNMHPYASVFDNVHHLQRLRTQAQCGRRNLFTIIQQGREGWRLSYVAVTLTSDLEIIVFG